MYTRRGAQPRPMPGPGLRRSSWRGSLGLVFAMFGWLLFMLLLASVGSAGTADSGQPVDIGRGVVVTPADGWSSAAGVWDVGPGAVSFQRAGALVAFAAEEYSGTDRQLLNEELSGLDSDFDSFRALPASGITIAGDLPALSVLFSGTSDSSQQEGELVAATSAGTGVLMLAVAPRGQLTRVQGDLNDMLGDLVIPR